MTDYERGVEYITTQVEKGTLFNTFSGGESVYYFILVCDGGAGIEMWSQHFTIQQAIDATLGRGECHMVLRDDICAGAYMDTYECDVCGEQIERGTVMGVSEPPNFCPNCGRRVVE